MQFSPAEEKLNERVKELSCLYEISKIITQTNSINKEALKKIILSIKKAWRFSTDAIIEIQVLDYYLVTKELPESIINQQSTIQIPGEVAGFIKVNYPKNKYKTNAFLAEEQRLLDTIAIEIGNYIEKFKTLEKNNLLNSAIERMNRLTLLGKMTAGIAHEINNPLSNILGFAELMKHQNTNPSIDSDIETIINSVMYSREIAKKLLFFSGDVQQNLKQQELKPIFSFALSFLKPNFQKKKIKAEIVFMEEKPIAKVDSVQLTQVLFNLLINAIYASPDNSTIRILIETVSQNVLISIEDQGTGIPEFIKSQIFNPFFTTKSNSDGFGLGLSVVSDIIKNHNGKIEVSDNSPRGTVFSITIPVS